MYPAAFRIELAKQRINIVGLQNSNRVFLTLINPDLSLPKKYSLKKSHQRIISI